MARKAQVKKLLYKRRTLEKGRPPTASKPQASLSKHATQKLIRSHHQLNKQIKMAESKGDEDKIDELKKRVNGLGGLKSYQLASMQGQANERGGDSSAVLMEWFQDFKSTLACLDSKIRMLEVGALSTKNACSKSGLFEIEGIDLYSQDEDIIQQDFMERPAPRFEKDQFDIISLSLVLNYVPSPTDRGEMLKRTCQFLDQRAPRTRPETLHDIFPALFLVLPAACIMNSRYMNEERLTVMMACLGYVSLKRKQTAKLIYYLWVLRDKPLPEEQKFSKTQINPGGGKNNFSIVLHK